MELEKIGTEFLVNTETYSDQYKPTITGLSGGGFVVSWYSYDSQQDTSSSGIKAQIYDAEGVKQGGEFLVNTETNLYQEVPTITGLSGGGFVVSWASYDGQQDGSGYGIKAQIYDAEGETQGAEFLVNTETYNTQYSPAITELSGGGFVVSWFSADGQQDTSSYGIKAQIFDAEGVKQGGEFLVNTETISDQYNPTITELSGGGFVVSWRSADGQQDSSGYGIKAQIFDAEGVKQGGEFLVNTETYGDQSSPAITGLSGGGFVVSWHSSDGQQDSSGYGIKAQIFDAEGVKQGGEFLVNIETFDGQYHPTITGLSGGGFVVSWYSYDGQQDGSGSAIKAQIFDAEGVKQGEEFLVNVETNNYQVFPAITEIGDGDFVIAWASADGQQDTSGYGIKAQIFSVDINSDPTGEVTLTGTPAQGETLTADTSDLGDADGLGEFDYQWLRDGDEIDGATGKTYELTQADVDGEISVEVSWVDGKGTEESVASAPTTAVANDNDDPTGEVALTGATTVGETLTADTSALADADGLGKFAYLWLRDGRAIDGATGTAHELTAEDARAKISVEVSWIDGYGVEETVTSAASATVLFGDLVLIGTDDAETLRGYDGADLLVGKAGDDTLIGGAGDDRFWAGDGADELLGWTGDDFLHGGAGGDTLEGNAGNDSLRGAAGTDTLHGGAGADDLKGGADDDVLKGGSGDDRLWGGAGMDVLEGGAGMDQLGGGHGADVLKGGAGTDALQGNGGSDTLMGHAGDDVLDGGNGQDVLVGGLGNDTLTGGNGADAFVFSGDAGTDTITDFEAGRDVIAILDGARTLNDLAFTQSGDDTLVRFAATEILVENITVETLQDADLFQLG
ncbi:calcium-binding protein [Tropicimonas sediminicola]|uniref:Hemolysin-type calcium-binding repeat-containing protein n=1 Tax=Tropicimonas sediminicola TaxID=1031541 RepID=A0A239DI30_9RHOB|nr:calcium-binding protein [Tropicimonas sediminicola]SNS32096.1 Hemolysin-type calcium-binding repeat-containing protein [Tropicimonas sediminicola]